MKIEKKQKQEDLNEEKIIPVKVDVKKFFKNQKGRIQYNETCKMCPYDCKQSWRASIINCKHIKELKDKEKQEEKLKKKRRP